MEFFHTVIVYLSILSFTSSSYFSGAKPKVTCVKASESRCKFNCGQDVLDLSAIDGNYTQPSFANIPDNRSAHIFYLWSPCTKFWLTNCSVPVYVGRVLNNTDNPQGPQSCNLGNYGPTVKVVKGRYKLVYVDSKEFLVGERRTDVYLKYDGLSKGRTSSMERHGGFFTMTLYTKYAPRRSAPKKKVDDDDSLSTGTVILIIVFCLTALYIGIGVPYMKFARGARGKEIIPHYSFWSEVPSLAKNGCSYTVQVIQSCACSTNANISTRKHYERI